MLEWINNNGTHTTKGENGVYTLTVDPDTKLWTIKQGRKIIGKPIKGIVNARNYCQGLEPDTDNDETEEEEEEVMAPMTAKRGRPAGTTKKVAPVTQTAKTATAKVTGRIGTATSVKKVAPVVAASAVKRGPKPKTVAAFPEYEESEFAVERETKMVRNKSVFTESEEDFKKRYNISRMQYGRAKKKYCTEHGIEFVPANPVTTSANGTRTVTPKKEKLSAEERFGAKWHTWEEISQMDFLVSRWDNAVSSKNHAKNNGRLHPHSASVQGQFYKAVERVYNVEQEIESYCKKTGEQVPVDYEYLGNTIDQLPDDEAEVMSAYAGFYANHSNPEQRVSDASRLILYPMLRKAPISRVTSSKRK